MKSEISSIARLFSAAAGRDIDPWRVTESMPELVSQSSPAEAFRLVQRYNTSCAWLPEAFMAFNAPGLAVAEKREMVGTVIPGTPLVDDRNIQELSYCLARLGSIGLSFPQWRFVAQGFPGGSLLERYGAVRLERENDVRSPDLPKSNPQRDEYGTGFVIKCNDGWTVEYRRAYVMCSCNDHDSPVTVIVRNSSHFFGRDRLEHPVYVSWDALSSEKLSRICAADFSASGSFENVQADLTSKRGPDIAEKIKRLKKAVEYFCAQDMKLSQWLRNDGFEHLQAFARHVTVNGNGVQFYTGFVDPGLPPWFPGDILPATKIAEGSIPQGPAHLKMVLMTGAAGDLPFKPNVLPADQKEAHGGDGPEAPPFKI